MALPTQKVEIQFGASSWVDVTSDAGNITITRGTNRVMDDYQAGSLQIVFTNNNRRFDPLNTSSDLWYGAGGYTLVQPAGKIRVTSNSTIVFYGYIQDWSFSFDSAGLDGNATVTAGDLMYYLSRVNFTGGTQELGGFTGDRISDVLPLYGLATTQVDSRNNRTVVGTDVNNAGDNVLSYLQNVARSEPGDLYASASSSATLIFKDRTFTDYSWTSSLRQNLIKYPSANSVDTTGYLDGLGQGNGWISKWSGSTAVYIYGGTASNGSEVRSITNDQYLSYHEINKTKYNTAGTAGGSYVFSAWFKGNALPAGVTGTLALLDVNGQTINNGGGSALVMSATAVSNAVWANMAGTVTANATAIVAGMSITVTAAGTTNASSFVGNAWYFENASGYDGSYWDGSYNPLKSSASVKREYAWLGTPYESSSVLAINSASSTPTPATYLTFADNNSQGTAYGNGTAIPFMTLTIANSGLNLYNQTQVSGSNATAIATDSAGTALYGLRTYSQTDNLTTSLTRPAEIAEDVLGIWRLPEYRAEEFTVALEALTSAQQNLVLGLELRDVIRLCFQPSAMGSVVDKYYQILSINTQNDVERSHISFQVASLANVPIRVDSTLTAKLNTSIVG